MILRKSGLFVFLLLLLNYSLFSQIKVAFESQDGLLVVADHYMVNKTFPYILLFHQLESSRGEFKEIAPKLNKLGFNCLAVDLRAGNEINFVRNETAMNATAMKLPARTVDTKKDIVAAIEYVRSRNDLPVILLGSSYSASLALILAREREDVQAVVAFSPGEYFSGNINVKNQLKGLHKPVFIASTRTEKKYVIELAEGIPEKFKQIFTPAQSEGAHGAKALWEVECSNNEYWLALIMFFNSLKSVQVN